MYNLLSFDCFVAVKKINGGKLVDEVYPPLLSYVAGARSPLD